MKVILLALSLLGCSLAMPVGVDESDNPRPVVPLVITDYSSVASKAAESTAVPSSALPATISEAPAKADLEPQPTEAATDVASSATENDAIRSIDVPTPNLQETAKVADEAAEPAPKEAVAQVPEVKPEEMKEELKAVPLASDVTIPQVNKDAIVAQDGVLDKQASEKTEIKEDAPAEETKPAESPIKLDEKEVKNAEDMELSLDATENAPTVAPAEKMEKETTPEEKIKEDSSSEESKEKPANPLLIAEPQPNEPKTEVAEEKKDALAENKAEEKKPEGMTASRRRRHVKEEAKPLEENKKPTNAPKKEKEEKKGKSEVATKTEEEVKPTESIGEEKIELKEIIPQPAIVPEQSADVNQKDIKDKLNSEEKVVSDETDRQTMEPAKIETKREVAVAEEKKETAIEKEIPAAPVEPKKAEEEKDVPKAEIAKELPKEEQPQEVQRNEERPQERTEEQPQEEQRKEEQPQDDQRKEEKPTAISEKVSGHFQENTASEKKAESIEKIPEASVEKEDSPVIGTSLSTSEEKNMELKADSKSDESS